MRRRLSCCLTTGLFLGLTGWPALAQKRVVLARPQPAAAVTRPDTARPTSPPRTALPPGTTARPEAFHRISASSYVLSRLDDNVNRDTVGVTSVGMITGLTGRLDSSPVRPWLAVEYDVALHRYSATERFNRVSQRLRSTLAARVRRWWTLDLVTEGSLKGSSEDRDVADQLAVQPRSEFRLGGPRRLRLVASQRWRRFPTDSLQDASNRYAAAEFRHRLSDGTEFEAEVRVESNEARGHRFDYRRTTYVSAYTTPLGTRASLDMELQYRVQRYPGRVVEIDDVDHARVDHRLQPALALQFRLGSAQAELSFEPEWRRSNDPGKDIAQHVLIAGVRRRW